MKKIPEKCGIYVAGNPRTVEAVAKAVIAIMKVPYVDNATKVAAIGAVERAGGAPVNINSCSVTQ